MVAIISVGNGFESSWENIFFFYLFLLLLRQTGSYREMHFMLTEEVSGYSLVFHYCIYVYTHVCVCIMHIYRYIKPYLCILFM